MIFAALVVFGLAVSAAAVAGLRDARSGRSPAGVELAATDYGERARRGGSALGPPWFAVRD